MVVDKAVKWETSTTQWGYILRCGAAEATGLGFVCFVVINSCVLSANRVDLGFFFYLILLIAYFFCCLFGVSDHSVRD